ncbi:MAG: hydroxymethylglutaryl-CoA reductase, degradative [Deltaproteobacteria bacterium]|nr:hydroxymethylglutaryl-CoA reductase, degradative [Deltaproteobacteria bacterium]
MTGDSRRTAPPVPPPAVGLRGLPPAERRRLVAAGAGLTAEESAALAAGGLDIDAADRMLENVIGLHALPLGVALNLVVNGRERRVPMALEEPSVVAGLSNAARMLGAGGGVDATASAPLMISQVQLVDVPDLDAATRHVLDARATILAACDAADPALVAAGGGARDLQVRRLDPAGPRDPLGPMLVVHLVVDVREAMGANAVNTMAERVAPELERLTGGRAGLRILTNLADRRTVSARGRVPFEALARGGFAGEDVARGIEAASVFAERDPYRAATHNKGIFNGIDALLLATGQDWRAVEAGGHAFAARSGRYGPLSVWRVRGDTLEGELTMPMAVGLIGGAVRAHAGVRAALKILGATGAADLAEVAAAVGLAQNLAALRALVSEGIQAGHMKLHRRKV